MQILFNISLTFKDIEERSLMNYKFLALTVSVILSSGCSTTEPMDTQFDYQSDSAQSTGNALEIPPDLTSPRIQNRYNIPGQTAANNNRTNIRTNLGVLSPIKDMHIEREGSQRWLLITGKEPAEIWPHLKAFWQDNGFVIKEEEPEIGFMETDWAENRAKLANDGLRRILEAVGLGTVYSTPERDKFLIRMEKTSNGIEIYFIHRGLYETYVEEGRSANTAWQVRPSDPNLEAVFLGRFMVRLGMSEEQVNTQVKAEINTFQTSRASIDSNSLVLNDNFDRAWRRVGLALDRIGLTVTDRNRSSGIYYVKPAAEDIAEKQEESFFSRLAFWRGSHDKKEDNNLQGEKYNVTVKQLTEGKTAVQILDEQGNLLNTKFEQKALILLKSELE